MISCEASLFYTLKVVHVSCSKQFALWIYEWKNAVLRFIPAQPAGIHEWIMSYYVSYCAKTGADDKNRKGVVPR